MFDFLMQIDRRLGPPLRDSVTLGDDPSLTSMRPAPWVKTDPMNRIYRSFETVLSRGILGYGQLFMANTAAFETGTQDAPAGVIYTFDRTLWRQPLLLNSMAERVYNFHSDAADHVATPVEPDQRLLLQQLYTGFERPFHQRLPPLVSDGFVVYHTGVMVIRGHVPGGYLAGRQFPVLVDLDGPAPIAVIVPSVYWPPGLIRRWEFADA
ncbi:MAG: hypothetical protein ACI9OJ_001902 [Myxococcota bacterium]|jgi:hypothetical protein